MKKGKIALFAWNIYGYKNSCFYGWLLFGSLNTYWSLRFAMILISTLIALFYEVAFDLLLTKYTNIRIYNVGRSSKRFKEISFLIIWADLILIWDMFSWVRRFFIKINKMLLESILVIGTLVSWNSATLNVHVNLLCTFHNTPRYNISICLCPVKGKFSPVKFPVIKIDKNWC